jgi:hypothetical protein
VAEAAPPAATAPPKPAPFSLKKGTRIQLGYRTGKVDALRSAGKKPYEVRITWDGVKYPQMILYRTLELEHEKGALAILRVRTRSASPPGNASTLPQGHSTSIPSKRAAAPRPKRASSSQWEA